MDITTLVKNKVSAKLPKLAPGDSVRVSFKIKEASRERVQTFPGLIIKLARNNAGGNVTVRRVTSGVGVEHTFPLASPLLEKIEVVRHGKVRRSKLYYIRRLSTKEARLKERRERIEEVKAITEASEATALTAGTAEDATSTTVAAEATAPIDKVAEVVENNESSPKKTETK